MIARLRGLILSAAVISAATGIAMPFAAQAQAQAPAAAPAATPVDLSGLWVVSNRTQMGPLDANGARITGEIYTPAARKVRAAVRPALDPSAMCLPSMPRHLGGPYPIQIMQSPGKIALLFEWDTVFRVVHLDSAEHPDPDVETRWMGHSTGRWEGATLVVDTTNFNGKAWLDGSGTPMSDKARLTEWFTRTDPATLQVKMKIEDPVNLLQPIYRTYYFNLRNDWQIKEYFCAEGNRDNVFANNGQLGSLHQDDVITNEK